MGLPSQGLGPGGEGARAGGGNLHPHHPQPKVRQVQRTRITGGAPGLGRRVKPALPAVARRPPVTMATPEAALPEVALWSFPGRLARSAALAGSGPATVAERGQARHAPVPGPARRAREAAAAAARRGRRPPPSGIPPANPRIQEESEMWKML
ncbi:hypothetical protein E2320_022330 [Naja naja]|nr:hypothetical protein E2320_022330 [Naja naja]